MLNRRLVYIILMHALFLASSFKIAQSNTGSDSLNSKNRYHKLLNNREENITSDTTKSLYLRYKLLELNLLTAQMEILNGNAIYTPEISYSNYLFYLSKFNEPDKLNSLKQNLAFSLGYGYRDLTKYSLGKVGYYLGITKNILAIILAILSL